MLSTADHLNQAIPARHEVESAIQRLLGADLISVDDGWFRVTPVGERLWRTRPHGGLATTVETMHNVLTRRHTPGQAEWVLDEEEHTAAVHEYAARIRIPAPRRATDGGGPR